MWIVLEQLDGCMVDEIVESYPYRDWHSPIDTVRRLLSPLLEEELRLMKAGAVSNIIG